MPVPGLSILPLALTTLLAAQETISFPTQDGGRICADLYGQGGRAVVLAHGGRFNKESWRNQARILVSRGFRALASIFSLKNEPEESVVGPLVLDSPFHE